MSLNPYEVRLEVLKMSAGMLNDEYYGKRQVIDFDWNEEVNLHREHKSHPPKHPGYPSFPSEEQVLEKANRLYKFISESK